MKVLVTGAQGMVGRAVCDHCTAIGDAVLSYGHEQLDIADGGSVLEVFEREKPDLIINCGAWTDVDGCEFDPGRAFSVNAGGPENLARASKRYNARFVTLSTDYVFDGRKAGFYTQHDAPNPTSVYAVSKLEGERRAHSENNGAIIVRTGFIFGPRGRNFLSTVVERARSGEKLQVIKDAYGTPTYSLDLAKRLRELAQLNHPGVYHVVNAGDGVSFEEFAREALAIAGINDVDMRTVSMDSLDRPASRPKNSRLRCLLSDQLGLEPMRHWRTALREFVEEKMTPR